jgi:hypothetical protein
MFWRKDKAPTAAIDPAAAPVVDAAAEEERIKSLTGGKNVVIKREKSGWVKLPGL